MTHSFLTTTGGPLGKRAEKRDRDIHNEKVAKDVTQGSSATREHARRKESCTLNGCSDEGRKIADRGEYKECRQWSWTGYGRARSCWSAGN